MQHVLNRGDHREPIFHKPGDFRAFLAVIAETASRIPMRVLAYCIMRNHFHLLLWPHVGSDLPEFMQLLMNLHLSRYLRHYRPSSSGHVYQDRYRNSLIESDHSLMTVARYVEANALSAGIVQRAEHYKWSSASPEAHDPSRPVLADWPVEKPSAWSTILNTPTRSDEWKRLQRCVGRGAPIGSPEWTATIAAAYDLEHTLKERGRPRLYENFVPVGEADSQT